MKTRPFDEQTSLVFRYSLTLFIMANLRVTESTFPTSSSKSLQAYCALIARDLELLYYVCAFFLGGGGGITLCCTSFVTTCGVVFGHFKQPFYRRQSYKLSIEGLNFKTRHAVCFNSENILPEFYDTGQPGSLMGDNQIYNVVVTAHAFDKTFSGMFFLLDVICVFPFCNLRDFHHQLVFLRSLLVVLMSPRTTEYISVSEGSTTTPFDKRF
jgi:hypothetical protein